MHFMSVKKLKKNGLVCSLFIFQRQRIYSSLTGCKGLNQVCGLVPLIIGRYKKGRLLLSKIGYDKRGKGWNSVWSVSA